MSYLRNNERKIVSDHCVDSFGEIGLLLFRNTILVPMHRVSAHYLSIHPTVQHTGLFVITMVKAFKKQCWGFARYCLFKRCEIPLKRLWISCRFWRSEKFDRESTVVKTFENRCWVFAHTSCLKRRKFLGKVYEFYALSKVYFLFNSKFDRTSESVVKKCKFGKNW